MARTLLLIGTRKGLFVLESDGDRRDWACAARSARAGPSTTRSTTPSPARCTRPPRASGTGRRSGAAPTWARPGRCRARGSATARTARARSRRSRRSPSADGQLLVGVEAPGIFESADGGESWSLLSTLAGQPGSEAWDDPANQPPGHLGISMHAAGRRGLVAFWAIVQGVGTFETADGGTSWTPRNRGLRADWPRAARGGRLLRPPARALAERPAAGCTSRTTSAYTARTTAATRGPRSPTGCRASSASPPPRIPTTATPST